MDEEGFLKFLRRGGRTPGMARKVIAAVTAFGRYLAEQRGVGLDQAGAHDLEAYVAWLEREPRKSAKGCLHALHYYYDYIANEDMARLAGLLRQERIKRAPFPLREFRSVQPEHVEKLEAIGVRNADQVLAAAGRRLAARPLPGGPASPKCQRFSGTRPPSWSWSSSLTWPAYRASRAFAPGYTTTPASTPPSRSPAGSQRRCGSWPPTLCGEQGSRCRRFSGARASPTCRRR